MSDRISQIIALENGDLDAESTIALFQAMIDDGTVWVLQGSYGRAARDLIESGECRPAHANYPHTPGTLYDCQACEQGPCECNGAGCVSAHCNIVAD